MDVEIESIDKGITLLFLCKCSSNISNYLDFDQIKAWVKSNKDIDLLITANLLCSPKEKETFSKVINGNNKYVNNRKIKSIVIAACSPKLHEKTFQELAEKEGINISKIQFANIREQCAWVTPDKNEATRKAINLINAAINRSYQAEDLIRQKMPVLTDIMIVGGGITGIGTALTLARAGRKVYLVDREISLGGAVIKSEEVAPNMECAPCLLAPILAQVRDEPNITVVTGAEVTNVVGFFGNFKVTVRQKARYVNDTCIGCEECFKDCPVSVKHEFHEGLGERKAIYTLFAGSVPIYAAIDRENCRHFIDNSCEECKKNCMFESIDFEQQDKELTFDVGSVVLATGFKSYNPARFINLGYQTIENVYITPEFERLASSNGPTGGEIILKNNEKPSSAAVIHCAGSLDENGIPYCSSVCCMNALKVGELLRKKNPDVKVYNIYHDLVLTSPRENQFYKTQVHEGTRLIKTQDLASLSVIKTPDGRIQVSGNDFEPLEVDMVILSTGLMPNTGAIELSQLFSLDLDKYGYFKSDHELIHKTGSVIDGVYLAGCALAPCNVPDSITQGQATAGDILSKLIPGREIELEVMTACIDETICSGCKLCIAVCPYKAINYQPDKGISMINEAICRGCGTCAATCPSGAIMARHFSDLQINAELEGVLDV